MGAILLCVNFAKAQENNWTSSRPDGHAPIGVMGDHYHHKGEIMFGYRTMMMNGQGITNGTNDVEDMELYQHYMNAPQNMSMMMHMFGAMYAVSDNITFMAMGKFIDRNMNGKNMMGMVSSNKSSGFGDVSIAAAIKIFNKNRQSLHSNLVFSIPTGSINQRSNMGIMTDIRMGYPMQIGSGSFETGIVLTYLGQRDNFSWGAQSKYRHRLNENNYGYKTGNSNISSAWFAYKAIDQLSFSIRASYDKSSSISGKDMEIDMMKMMAPPFNAKNSGREQFNLSAGTNFMFTNGGMKGLRIGLEFGKPIYQNVIGYQMKRSYFGVIGLQYSFGGHN